MERITNWDQLSEREQDVARRRIAKRNKARLALLQQTQNVDAANIAGDESSPSLPTTQSTAEAAGPPSPDSRVVAVFGSGKFGTAMAIVMVGCTCLPPYLLCVSAAAHTLT